MVNRNLGVYSDLLASFWQHKGTLKWVEVASANCPSAGSPPTQYRAGIRGALLLPRHVELFVAYEGMAGVHCSSCSLLPREPRAAEGKSEQP